MADTVRTPDIEILAGLKGGGTLSGDSGQLILNQLTAIANSITLNVKVGIDEGKAKSSGESAGRIYATSFQSQLAKINFSKGITGKTAEARVKSEMRLARAFDSETLKLNTTLAKENNEVAKSNAKLATSYNSLFSNISKRSAYVSKSFAAISNPSDVLQKKFKSFGNAVNKAFKIDDTTPSNKIISITSKVQKLAAEVEKLIALERNATSAPINDAKYNELLGRVQSQISAIEKSYPRIDKFPDLSSKFARLSSEVMNSPTPERLREINAELIGLNKELKLVGAGNLTGFQKFGNAVKKFAQYLGASTIILRLIRGIKSIFKTISELDGAMTDLRIASGMTRDEVEKTIDTFHDLAGEIGATTTEVAKAADTWLRQGYSVAEATELIRASMMLSKLGQIESAEASKALTSAMKGYKVSVEDATDVVDKLTAVDMVAAVSAGDIATAMAETAVSADIAGLSMDKLIGYLAEIQEVTQDAPESVGTFMKTLLSRMGNVKSGRLVDPETEESLGDVERVLSGYGILLRDSNSEFRNFGEVLDEVAANWNNYGTVAQRAIAVAFSGYRVA